MPVRRSCEVHLASDVISRRLEDRFLELGFARDRFVGGTTGVVHPCHFTADPPDMESMIALWTQCADLLSEAGAEEFHGYGEAEITSARHRIEIPYKPYDAAVRFPYERFEFEECPLGQSKKFDIHVTVDLATLDQNLQNKLEEECNFHYVDIAKPEDALVRVYTIQPYGDNINSDIWAPLLDYFSRCGGFEGKIKLEVCTHFARFPAQAQCCPVVTSVAEAA